MGGISWGRSMFGLEAGGPSVLGLGWVRKGDGMMDGISLSSFLRSQLCR
jgi:hypothetical protein